MRWLKQLPGAGQIGAALLLITGPLTNLVAEPESEFTGEVQRIEINIKDRKIVLDNNVVRVTQGDNLELVWSTDEAVSLHLHGYDIEVKLEPEEPTVMAFRAHATGRFPVTSHGFGDDHHGHDTLLYLEVYPR